MAEHRFIDHGDDDEPPTSTVQGILAVALQTHLRDLEKRDVQIQELKNANLKLNDEYAALHKKYSESRRSIIEKEADIMARTQHHEQELASLEMQITRLKSELQQRQQEHMDREKHLTSERDKANHIIKTLLKKVRQSPTH